MSFFPFFVGCDRSGTTLIQAVFDSHSELAIPYESHFIPNLVRRQARYESEAGFDLEGFAADLFAYPFGERWGLARSSIEQRLQEARPRSVKEGIERVFRLYSESRGKQRFGDKTPGYVRRIPLIAEAFPEAKFVHIIRDGRDVALSLLQVEWAPDSIVDAARFWKLRVEAGRRDGRALHPSRYTELRYEAFLEDPKGQTQRICEFLGLEFEEAMLQYSERAGSIIGQSDVPHRHQGLKDAPTKGRRDWRTQMSAKDVALFEAVAGTTLTSFGYDRGAEKIPLAVTGQAKAQLLARKAKGIPDRIRSEVRPRLKRLPKAP